MVQLQPRIGSVGKSLILCRRETNMFNLELVWHYLHMFKLELVWHYLHAVHQLNTMLVYMKVSGEVIDNVHILIWVWSESRVGTYSLHDGKFLHWQFLKINLHVSQAYRIPRILPYLGTNIVRDFSWKINVGTFHIIKPIISINQHRTIESCK